MTNKRYIGGIIRLPFEARGGMGALPQTDFEGLAVLGTSGAAGCFHCGGFTRVAPPPRAPERLKWGAKLTPLFL